mmetsp:Transcript_20823/g.37958  ORF Transcript_20823/g.37958 Transcript_20823/m.37958 type:complete len:163 (-) Transcript_20823:25-513(-)
MKFVYVCAILAIVVSCTQAGLLKAADKQYKPGDIEIIKSENVPAPIGSYSQGTKLHLDGFSIIYSSGQIGIDPKTGELVPDLIDQTHQALKNLEALIVDNGGDLSHVTRANLFLSDMANFKTVDEVYSEFFTENYPARAAVAVKDLPKYCFFEIMVEAVVPE